MCPKCRIVGGCGKLCGQNSCCGSSKNSCCKPCGGCGPCGSCGPCGPCGPCGSCGPCCGPCAGPCSPCGPCGSCHSSCCGQAPCGMVSYRLQSGPVGPLLPSMEYCGCCSSSCCPPFYFVPNPCACCWEWGCFGPYY